MNINELSSSMYGNSIRSIQASGYDQKLIKKTGEESEKTESFEDILSSYALSGDTDDLAESIKNLSEELKSSESSSADKSDVMSIITDAHIAKEYLESKSGRNLIVSMAENSIASIVAGNDDN